MQNPRFLALLLPLLLALPGVGFATTFNDVAPILYSRCSPCHRNGQAGPFDLVTFQDAKKHAEQIAIAVENGVMPPWLPSPNPAGFKNDRTLSSGDKALLLSWIANGTQEGDAAALPPAPQWTAGWSYGTPDLIVQMPVPYKLSAEGPDVYRNFIIPNVVNSNVNVRLLEFRPGNSKVLHHTFIKVDDTEKSISQEKLDNEVGFAGMNNDAIMPSGQFLSWQPGRQPDANAPVWSLKKGSDLVIQTHLTRSGKPELFQPSIGLYFTKQPAQTNYVKLFLGSMTLQFKAGATNQVVEDTFVIPVACEVASILPHAHYLCKSMEATAETPSGSILPLLEIQKWDFNWQGDYQYQTPISLPAGTRVKIRYTFDNSALNSRNPSNPPVDVFYGPQSRDEMCEFWMQVIVTDPKKRSDLQLAVDEKWKALMHASILQTLIRNPSDSGGLADLGLFKLGNGEMAEAERLFTRAIRANARSEMGHYRLGLIYRMSKRLLEADREFRRTVEINPSNEKAWGNLGFVQAELGHVQPAVESFQKALKLDPTDKNALTALRELQSNLRN